MTTSTSAAELMAMVPRHVANRFGPGRGHLLAAYGREQVTLPESTVGLLQGLARTEQARRELTTYDPGAARNGYNDAVTDALRHGHDLPSLDEVEDIERRARLQEMRHVAINQAQQLFADQLETNLSEGDTIVAAHVRPALEAVYAEAKSLLDKHGALMTSPAEAIVSAPAAVGKAWTRFGALTEHASTLHNIHAGLTAATAGRDNDGMFSRHRNDPRDPRLWGASYGVHHQTNERPWPTDPRGYLGWLLTSRLEVWVPTGVERDQRWGELFGKPATDHRLAGAVAN